MRNRRRCILWVPASSLACFNCSFEQTVLHLRSIKKCKRQGSLCSLAVEEASLRDHLRDWRKLDSFKVLRNMCFLFVDHPSLLQFLDVLEVITSHLSSASKKMSRRVILGNTCLLRFHQAHCMHLRWQCYDCANAGCRLACNDRLRNLLIII